MECFVAVVEIDIQIRGLSSILFHRYPGTDSPASPGPRGDKNPRALADIHLHCAHHPERGDVVFIPGNAIFAALINAGKFHKLGKSKLTTGKTSLVPAYLGVKETTPWLYGADNKLVTRKNGWEVQIDPVVNPSTGGRVICHRPRVDVWSCRFTMQLFEPDKFGENLARDLLDDAGTKIGLLAWRTEKKGPHGKFRVESWSRLP